MRMHGVATASFVSRTRTALTGWSRVGIPMHEGETRFYARVDPALRKARGNEIVLGVASGKLERAHQCACAGRASVRRRPSDAGSTTGNARETRRTACFPDPEGA